MLSVIGGAGFDDALDESLCWGGAPPNNFHVVDVDVASETGVRVDEDAPL